MTENSSLLKVISQTTPAGAMTKLLAIKQRPTLKEKG